MVCWTHDTTCCMYFDKVSTRTKYLTNLFRHLFHTITYSAWTTRVTMKCCVNARAHPLIPMTTCCSECIHTNLHSRSRNETVFYSLFNTRICSTCITYGRDACM